MKCRPSYSVYWGTGTQGRETERETGFQIMSEITEIIFELQQGSKVVVEGSLGGSLL